MQEITGSPVKQVLHGTALPLVAQPIHTPKTISSAEIAFLSTV